MAKKLTVSASPHVRSNETTTGIMLDVIIALMPALDFQISNRDFNSFRLRLNHLYRTLLPLLNQKIHFSSISTVLLPVQRNIRFYIFIIY